MLSTLQSILFLLFIVKSNGQNIEFGFTEEDFSAEEGVVTVTLIKTGPNTAPFTVTVTPFTFAEFSANNFPLPPELANIMLPDPAEIADFDTGERAVTFMSIGGEELMTLDFMVNDDNIHELQEGLYLLATAAPTNDASDNINSVQIRNGVALINIFNNDELTLSFQNTAFTVPEEDQMVSNVVFIEKDIDTEVVLPVMVSANSISATLGEDYEFDTTTLIFQPSDNQLSVDFNLLEDSMVEDPEMFLFIPSLPANPVPMYRAVSQAAVTITDNDVAVIGFEQVAYTANEGDLFVEVCFVVSVPANFSMFSALVLLAASSSGDTAEGGGVDFVDYAIPVDMTLVTSARRCDNITLIDDDLVEPTEQFDLSGSIAFTQASVTFDPASAVVFIEDNDDSSGSVVTMNPSTDDTAGGGENLTTTMDPGPTMTTPTMATTTGGMGGDPHFSILLPTGQPLCFSIQGEHGFIFSLIASDQLQVNALFVPDAVRNEVTWIGALGIVVKGAKYKTLNDTKLRFVAKERKVYLDDGTALAAKAVKKIHLANGKLSIEDGKRDQSKQVVIDVVLEDVGLDFSVRFVKRSHLDMVWKKVLKQQGHPHGLIGQFFRPGVEVDETRGLLELPSMDPVPVMRKPIWHFMERETSDDKLCWVAMNPGYQGKRLIEGHFFDYLVDNLLSSNFKFTVELND